MSDMAIATAGLAHQQATLQRDVAMMMLKQVVQQEQAVLQLVQAATQAQPTALLPAPGRVDVVV